MKAIRKLLIANRGEIACRIIKSCQSMFIETVAVFSDADADSLHVKLADQAVRIGPPPSLSSYLNQAKIIEAAKVTGADAIHPGYGFLAENQAFALLCEENGLNFVGPPTPAIEVMASKIEARKLVAGLGVPVLPGYHSSGGSFEEIKSAAIEVGFPLLIKSSAGGGGIGMKSVESMDQFDEVFDSVQREAKSSFDDDSLFLEKKLSKVRHIEVQVAADQQGNVIHLFERDCSVQRRRQKVVEETPAPGIPQDLLDKLTEAAVQITQAVGYLGLGTVEFLVEVATDTTAFYFLEMNTRLQVEHGITEKVTGRDLVNMQLNIAQGKPLNVTQADIKRAGHAIECRIYAEDPAENFQPSTGKLIFWKMPESDAIRVDDGMMTGSVVHPYYDNMLAKIITWADSREQAAYAMESALRTAAVFGVKTNIELLKSVVTNKEWLKGQSDTDFLEQSVIEQEYATNDLQIKPAIAAVLHYIRKNEAASAVLHWEGNQYLLQSLDLMMNHHQLAVKYQSQGTASYQISVGDHTYMAQIIDWQAIESRTQTIEIYNLIAEIDTVRESFAVTADNSACYVHHRESGTLQFTYQSQERSESPQEKNTYLSPMSAKVVRVLIKVGDQVEEGQHLMILETMKMESIVKAKRGGTIEEINVSENQQIEAGEQLLRLE